MEGGGRRTAALLSGVVHLVVEHRFDSYEGGRERLVGAAVLMEMANQHVTRKNWRCTGSMDVGCDVVDAAAVVVDGDGHSIRKSCVSHLLQRCDLFIETARTGSVVEHPNADPLRLCDHQQDNVGVWWCVAVCQSELWR